MKIAVLGGGMVGSLIATQLSKKYELVVYDNTQLKLKNIKTIVNDVTDKDFPNKLKNYNLVINCLPGFMGYSMLETIIELDLPCIDISFMPENCLDLSNGRTPMESTIIPDAGVAPGLSNLIVGNLSTKNNIEEIQIMVGGLPKEKNPPWNYRAPFSPIDVIEEYTRPARAKIDNKIITKKALSDIKNFEVEGIGELEAFLTDGLRTILDSDPKISKIPNLLEYTIRYPGHAKLVQELIEQDAFSDEIIEFQGKMITKKESTCMDLFKQWKLTDEDEFTLMRLIRVNIFNTVEILKLLSPTHLKKYFVVSTDKATNPVNMMGASKRIMEKFLFRESEKFNISMARFANVAFSDGSLLHGFNQRIQKNED